MSIATQIQSLRLLIDRFAEGGSGGAANLVRQMRGLASEANGGVFAELVAVCEATAQCIETLLGNEQFAAAAEEIEQHLREVIEYAEAFAASVERGEMTVRKPAPEPLSVGTDRESVDQQFAESVGMFVSNALTSVSDIEEELLTVEAAGDNLEETVANIRRGVHTLKAEFDVLNMLAPQDLCHQAETTIDAVVEHGAPFPVDVMLQFSDQIRHFLERLAADVHSQFGDAEPMLVTLREIEQSAKDQPADGDEPVDLAVGGDFADSLPDFISEARSHLADAEVAIVELSRDSGNVENLNLTFRAFHTIKGVAGFLNLTSLVELAHVAETLLDGARSERFQFEAEDIDVVLAAGDMISQMIGAMEGELAPTTGEWRKLIKDIQARSDLDRGAASQADGQAAEPAVTLPAATRAETANPAAAAPSNASGTNGGIASQDTAQKRPEVKAARVERTIKVSDSSRHAGRHGR